MYSNNSLIEQSPHNYSLCYNKKTKQTSILILKGSKDISNKKVVKQVSGSYSQWYYNIALSTLAWHNRCLMPM